MEEDPNKIPELSREDHAEFRDRFVRVYPDVILIDAKEPHKKLVERLARLLDPRRRPLLRARRDPDSFGRDHC